MTPGDILRAEGFRPVPFWSWNDLLDETELHRQLDEMKRAGYGGCFIHSRVGRVTGYLSDDWMKLVRSCAEYGSSLGLDVWLYDEDLWPSGFAGGRVPKLCERFREKNLVLLADSELRSGDRVLERLVCGGSDCSIAVRTAAADDPRFGGACYIDTFCPDAVDAFLESTHERYAERMSDLFKSKLKGIFTDEPAFGMYHAGRTGIAFGETVEAEFRRRKGYDFLPRVRELFFDEGGYRALRYDYYDVCGQLFRETFFGKYHAWCAGHGLLLTGHVMGEDTLCEQTFWLGSAMPVYEHMDVPGVDKLFKSLDGILQIKQLTSAAEQLGKPRALCECFAGIGQDQSFEKRKQILDFQALLGINFVNPHLSLYSMRGERKRDYPPNFFYQQPYFAAERLFSDYAARLSAAASFGRAVIRVLVLHPIGSVWSEYTPLNGKRAKLDDRIDRPFRELLETLARHNVDFHLGDETLLERHAVCEDGRLRMGESIYDKIILPYMSTVRSGVAELLRGFRGELLVLGERPSRIDGRNLRPEWNIRTYFDDAESLAAALKQSGCAVCEAEGVRAAVREQEGNRLYLFANPDLTESKSVRIRIPERRKGFVLDLSAGRLRGLPERFDGSDRTGLIEFQVEFAPGGSLVLWFGEISGTDLPGYADGKTPDATEVKQSFPAFEPCTATRDGAVFRRIPVRGVLPRSVRAAGENLLPLKRCDFWADGKPIAEELPLAAVWHPHFYSLPEGTPFSLVYRFRVRTVPSRADLLIENAENLETIVLNGSALKPQRSRGEPQRFGPECGFDLSLTRVPCGSVLCAGENVLTLTGVKVNNISGIGMHRDVVLPHAATEAEVCYLAGDFGVFTEDGERWYVDAVRPLSCGEDVCRNGYPFFAGSLVADYDPALARDGLSGFLHGNASACAEIRVDGRPVCGAANPPWFVEVPPTDARRLEIIYYNTLYNAVGPTEFADYDELPWVDPAVFNDLGRFRAKSNVKPFRAGILDLMEEEINK